MLVASASGGRAHQVHGGVLDVGQEEGVQGVQPGLPQVPQVARHQRRPRLHQHQLPSASSSLTAGLWIGRHQGARPAAQRASGPRSSASSRSWRSVFPIW